MRAAFFKGRHPGWRGIFGILIKHWMDGHYSHVELQFSDGMCGSSLYRDDGVRLKQVDFDPAEWDFIDLPDAMEPAARQWFNAHLGKAYDFLGDMHFVIGTIAASRDKWFCSRAVADSLGLQEGWRYDPNSLFDILQFITRPADAGFFTPIEKGIT